MDKEQTRKLDVIKEHYENLTANTNLTNIHFNVLRDDKHQPNLKLDWSVAQMQAWDKLQRSIDWLTYYFFLVVVIFDLQVDVGRSIQRITVMWCCC